MDALQTYISCVNASFAYDGNTVLSGINFNISSGDYICVVGENGSGKSTLVKGLLKLKSPQSGEIAFYKGLKRNEIGYLPQQTEPRRDFPAGVFEITLSGLLPSAGLRPFYTVKNRETAERNLSLLGVENLKNKCFRELSGGQQRRVLLARALCASGKMLLLDEPAAGLDPGATYDLYNAVSRLNQTEGVTVVMVSHDIHHALDNARKILHLQNRQLFFGSADEYRSSDIGRKFTGGCCDD